ncbi:hypothetical protein E4U43_000151 [Claviceps pusilla]|uniref:Uncharacterized protein n=1 Tax=Claviceps pusilla TaxID=123648 RepID=A0A9P7SZB9_9HYPO|nr:hypothetical protein E4U43_000151 [Claviceps pusilla]
MSPERFSLAAANSPDENPEPALDAENHDLRTPIVVYQEDRRPMSGESISDAGAQEDEDRTCRLQPTCLGHHVEDDDDDDDIESKVHNRPLGLEHIRHVVRLFQCRRCSKPFNNPITLPCGQTLCKTCIPETHARTSITYPPVPDRLQGFRCPFNECSKVHALSDCGVDVVMNKIGRLVEEEIDRAKLAASELNVQTSIQVRNPWHVAGISSLHDSDPDPNIIPGGQLVSTWSLALQGGLALEAEVIYTDACSSASNDYNAVKSSLDISSLARLQTVTRQEMDCQVCYALLHDPLTTGCGHTFCRPCLHRTLDHSNRCPICRRILAMNPLLNPELCPPNESIIRITEHFWPQEKTAREEAVAAEIAARHEDLDLPLFVCTLAFPAMPTFLHVFEPRYRLMIRRVLEGNKTFGMVLPRRAQGPDDRHFHQLGTLLRIINAQFYPDGRSLVETVGITRFRVVRFGELDGYTVAKTERIDDVSLEEEEAAEAAEAAVGPEDDQTSVSSEEDTYSYRPRQMADAQTQTTEMIHEPPTASQTDGMNRDQESQISEQPPEPVTADVLQTMSTRSLMKFAIEFVARMRTQSVPWLTARMLAIYGECPDDPAIFPWWFASMLPVKDLEKYRLLATSSVRERLKICCMWIVEWETKKCWG